MTRNVVGSSVLKPDALAKVCGRAIYAADIRRENMTHARAVRSPLASARIKQIDTALAAAAPGLIAVFTAKDIPGKNLTGARLVKDQPVLAEETVRFFGEAVALVVAESEEEATAATSLVQVDYEPLPLVDDPETALLHDSPAIHPQGKLCNEMHIVRGDFRSVLDRAAAVVCNTFTTPFVDHACLEPDAVVAEPTGDGLTLWVTSKSPHADQAEVARVLDLAIERVAIVVVAVGGSFGGKTDIPMLCMAGLAALKTGRPVMMVLDRNECFAVKTKRHPYRMTYMHAVAADGTLLGAYADVIADAGAYASYTPRATSKGLLHAVGPYRVPNVDLRIRAPYTNHPISGAMRGYGVPQVMFAVERQMDMIARKLAMDPFELRLKNVLRPGDMTITGQVVRNVALAEALSELKKRADAVPPAPELSSGCKRAWGIATCFYGCGRAGTPDKARVSVALESHGLVRVFVGTPDTGQGSDTVLAQIAAQEMGLPFEMVMVTSGDTRVTFDAGTSTASRVTYIVGNAVRNAAEKLNALLLEAASEQESSAIKRLPADPERLAELFRYCQAHNIEPRTIGDYQTETRPLDESGQGEPYGTYSFGAQMSLVQVNTTTGQVQVERVISCYDVGTVLNPRLLRAQVEGGTAMAQGYALTEQVLLDKCTPINSNFHTYLVPTALDISPIETETVRSFDEAGPFGAKGVGEPATLPGAASIANAISAAVERDFCELPITAERIVDSLLRG